MRLRRTVALWHDWSSHNNFTRCLFASEEIAGLPVCFKGTQGNFFRLSHSLATNLSIDRYKQTQIPVWFPYEQNTGRTEILLPAGRTSLRSTSLFMQGLTSPLRCIIVKG
jgi:hypothetical protein